MNGVALHWLCTTFRGCTREFPPAAHIWINTYIWHIFYLYHIWMRVFSFTHLRVVPPLSIEQTFYIWDKLEFSNRNTALSFPVHCKQTNMEEKLAKFRERRKLGKPDNVDNGWSPLQWLRSREQVSHGVNGDVHIFQPITCWWATKIGLIIQGTLKDTAAHLFLSPPPLHTHTSTRVQSAYSFSYLTCCDMDAEKLCFSIQVTACKNDRLQSIGLFYSSLNELNF